MKKNKRKSKVLDCRINGEYSESRDEGKVTLQVNELNCYILVDSSKIDTPEKKKAYIDNYVANVLDTRMKFYEL